jgi:hypothetical protein
MFQSIRTMIDRYRETRALDALTERDLADLGMSREQVAHFIRMPADTPDRVVAMARIFGLSEGEVKRDHGEWIDLVGVCAECADRGACGVLLGKGDLANPRDATFCPNHKTFEQHWQAA